MRVPSMTGARCILPRLRLHLDSGEVTILSFLGLTSRWGDCDNTFLPFSTFRCSLQRDPSLMRGGWESIVAQVSQESGVVFQRVSESYERCSHVLFNSARAVDFLFVML
jgi:hypothetical protein